MPAASCPNAARRSRRRAASTRQEAPAALDPIVRRLSDSGIRVSLFIDPDPRQVDGAVGSRRPSWSFTPANIAKRGLPAIARRGRSTSCAGWRGPRSLRRKAGLEVHAGHGLDYETAAHLAALAANPRVEHRARHHRRGRVHRLAGGAGAHAQLNCERRCRSRISKHSSNSSNNGSPGAR